MERDVYYDKMIFNSMEFTYRYFRAEQGVRILEYSKEDGVLYYYHDILLTDNFLEGLDGGDQPLIKSGSTNEDFVLYILAGVKDDIYYGLYVREEEDRYKLFKNGYCNREENGGHIIIPLDGKTALNSEKYFYIAFQDLIELEVTDETQVV